MKRKFEHVEAFEAKRTREDGNFSILSKRKQQFEVPNSKRFHSYNVIDEKNRYIEKLENIINLMMKKCEQLEYQLEITRFHGDRYNNNNYIQSF